MPKAKRRLAGMLQVPHVDQDDDYSCVPACVKMVVQFHHQRNNSLPNPTFDEIKRAIGTRPDGTMLDDVPKVNRLLKSATHKLEFTFSERASFEEIEKELSEGRPVIAWLKKVNDRRIASHSVVIKEVSRETLTIAYEDPFYGQQASSITQFMGEWNNSANILIRATIDEKPPQREMEEYI